MTSTTTALLIVRAHTQLIATADVDVVVVWLLLILCLRFALQPSLVCLMIASQQIFDEKNFECDAGRQQVSTQIRLVREHVRQYVFG